MTQAPSPAERRNTQRTRSLLGAQIVFRGGNCAINGQILNFSETGALVRPADLSLCPEQFALKPRFEKARPCEVVWRKGGTVGVRYV
jgi:hypothetical protein